MRCIDLPSTDIYFNLAAEEYLLKQCTDNVFMLWQATAAVVIGKHQRWRAEVDAAFAQARGIPVARRLSGGGAVYHDSGNLNLTFIENVRLPRFDEYLQRTLGFLSSLGIAARADDRLGLYIGGLKVSGSAQCVHRGRILYHCTLLFDTDLVTLNRVLNAPPSASPDAGYGVPSVRSEVANIKDYLPEPLIVAEFRQQAFGYFAGGSASQPFDEAETEAICLLREGKYSRGEWICCK